MMEERPETPVWVQGGRLLPRDWALKEGSGLVGHSVVGKMRCTGKVLKFKISEGLGSWRRVS